MKRVPRTIALTCLLALVACGPSSERLKYRTLDSKELSREMSYALLLPPDAGSGEAEVRHVFYVLHGLGDDHRSLDRFGVSDRLHAAMLAGRLPRAHVVAPGGERGFYVNWYDGTNNYEDYLLQDVLPTADAELGVEPGQVSRHLLGVSMGGLGAIQIGLRHPDLFASISSLSGFLPDVDEAKELIERMPKMRGVDLRRVFGDCSDQAFVDAHNPYQVVRLRDADPGQRIFLAVGDRERDEFIDANRAFHELLEQRGVPHEYLVYEGRHRWRDWAPIIERAMSYATSQAR